MDKIIHVNARAIIERCVGNAKEIVIQTRNKPGQEKLELPGGRVNEFESFADALKREVLEETGLKVVEIEGQESRIDTTNMSDDFFMGCVKPFAVYQTLKGPVDSMGAYFKCQVTGTIQEEGDCTLNIKWIDIKELDSLVHNQKELFSEIYIAGILFYLNEKRSEENYEGWILNEKKLFQYLWSFNLYSFNHNNISLMICHRNDF